jgi:hypothetical protein
MYVLAAVVSSSFEPGTLIGVQMLILLVKPVTRNGTVNQFLRTNTSSSDDFSVA